ncbi:MAG: sodium:proton exchanger [Deltaproteobacteria bacterium]|jgi:cation:H+ antiporter|nr:MAG: sodium:proton exchanger [Deltaproteobacteria bacterium]
MKYVPVLKIALALAVALPALLLRLLGVQLAPLSAIAVFGSAVVASAFLLVWASEAAHHDISSSLATAILAVIAVLPEYAVDLFFAWSAGHAPENAHYAAANMTGSNRLLLGLGWPFVVLLFVFGARRRGQRATGIVLREGRRVELGFLGAASIYSLVVPFTRRIAWYDSVVLLGIFFAYLWRAARGEQEAPELIGVAKSIGDLPRRARRAAVIGLMLGATAFVLSAAGPFATALVQGGRQLGIDEFLLVQWLAPISSESPELLVAAVLALRGHQDSALGTLLSAKVNQWSLLVGSLPIAYAIGGGAGGIALDARQTEEFILTAAQTVLGFAVLADLHLHLWEAIALLALFALQFPFPQTEVRMGFAIAYAALALALLVWRRRELPRIARYASCSSSASTGSKLS